MWVCSCPDFENRADAIEMCKHAFAVKFWIAARVELQEKPKPKVFAEDATQCDRCGSIRVIHFGVRNGKQAYYCNDCRHKFTPSLIRKARYSPETITLTLDLYFSGMSYNKIARTLNDNLNMNLGATSIYRWVNRFVPQISEYVNSLSPQLSEAWHADELFVRMKDGLEVKVKGKYKKDGTMKLAYLWNVMDRKTRFLLASKLFKRRDAVGAERAFKEAIANAQGGEPETVLTDSYRAYDDGIKFAFKEGNTKHIANAGLKKPNATNNHIERMNGTLRERVKVQRGWKTMKTQIAE